MSGNAGHKAYYGPGPVCLLQLLFIGLKLTDHIDWSWWLVLSPIWMTVLFVVILVVAVMVFNDGK